jgi:two-component system sensor histidine kinase MprB
MLVGAIAVAVTVVIVSTIAYLVVDDRLRSEADSVLEAQAVRLAELPVPELALPYFRVPYAGEIYYFQIIGADGTVARPEGLLIPTPVTARDRAIAAGRRSASVRDVTVRNQHFRVSTVPTSRDRAVQLARSVETVDTTLHQLQVTLLVVTVIAVAFAAIIGLLLARTALRPVRKLTRAAERVAATQDLDASIDVRGRDELGRLGTTINEMLAALNASRQQQRQLVADASHELRTPLTSLRTNIEVLRRQPKMDPRQLDHLLDDVTTELQGLISLVDDLVELASDTTRTPEETTDIELDELVSAVVDGARRRSPDVRIELSALSPVRVEGQRRQLERAFGNVLDNACKWSPPGATVEVTMSDGWVSVRDHGSGIDEEDLPHVFDRFYRATAARSLPGSGLGLAIVRRVIDAHDGSVTLARAPGGGTVATIRLPTHALNGTRA